MGSAGAEVLFPGIGRKNPYILQGHESRKARAKFCANFPPGKHPMPVWRDHVSTQTWWKGAPSYPLTLHVANVAAPRTFRSLKSRLRRFFATGVAYPSPYINLQACKHARTLCIKVSQQAVHKSASKLASKPCTKVCIKVSQQAVHKSCASKLNKKDSNLLPAGAWRLSARAISPLAIDLAGNRDFGGKPRAGGENGARSSITRADAAAEAAHARTPSWTAG